MSKRQKRWSEITRVIELAMIQSLEGPLAKSTVKNGQVTATVEINPFYWSFQAHRETFKIPWFSKGHIAGMSHYVDVHYSLIDGELIRHLGHHRIEYLLDRLFLAERLKG